ncbi:hypothetical protein [Pseudomonas sp. Irchel 3E13]|uniref:hypothetical protein n=1 Tax=Pseudomonas sp. Irchel 3E13 TaxID=2008975 RepID=UPI00117ACD83|nr:hypothetical protein [Pseudomonas sp. Irchel 3E13]
MHIWDWCHHPTNILEVEMMTGVFYHGLEILIWAVPTLYLTADELEAGGSALVAASAPVFRCKAIELGERHAALAVTAIERLAGPAARDIPPHRPADSNLGGHLQAIQYFIQWICDSAKVGGTFSLEQLTVPASEWVPENDA